MTNQEKLKLIRLIAVLILYPLGFGLIAWQTNAIVGVGLFIILIAFNFEKAII